MKLYKLSGAITGAAFLMATSAIGPGFINNTVLFTGKLGASFGFVILVSIILDIIAQMNIWRIVSLNGKHAQDIVADTSPIASIVLILLVSIGGFLFNIGNIAGAALGLQVFTGCNLSAGALFSMAIAVILFMYKNIGVAMDAMTKPLGMLMIALTLYVCFYSKPDLKAAFTKTIFPNHIDAMSIVTIVGGTVGGYISFAGAHRLLESGIMGSGQTKKVTRGAVSGILIASIMRYILFLAAFGIVSSGIVLSQNNPAQTVFYSAAGNIGNKLFGIVLWSAAITSVVGSAYTSISFLQTLHRSIKSNNHGVIIGFIILSTLVFLYFGNPVSLLKKAGIFNGMILPLAMSILLYSVHKSQYPTWLKVGGWLLVAAMTWLSIISMESLIS